MQLQTRKHVQVLVSIFGCALQTLAFQHGILLDFHCLRQAVA